ncbi:hypothetical protein TNCV_417041 [Trichonephila clavipes]|nr:hypothetical protein TNCV_417041 [Trichonephila clavipes]
MRSMVVQRLTQITPPAFTPDQFWQRVKAALAAVPQEHIQSLFESMPRRVVVLRQVSTNTTPVMSGYRWRTVRGRFFESCRHSRMCGGGVAILREKGVRFAMEWTEKE